MPTTASATYAGGAVGYVVQANAAGEFYGSSSLSVNFGSGSVTGSVTGIKVYDVDPGTTLQGTMNNIAFTAGSISGATMAGTTSATGSAGTAFDIAGATGTFKGGFYGPAAAEAAGVFNLSGGTNGTTVVGSFGAKQAPSDRRLKIEVEPAGRLANGLKLYSWRYLGGTHRFTGVMAQDLLADTRFAAAVGFGVDGLMRVDYARIGYLPADFAAMVEEGEAAIALYHRARH